MGIYLYSPRALSWVKEGEYLDFPDLILRMIAARQRVTAYQTDCLWLDIGRHDTQVLRGDALDTQVTRHLLVLERLARILAAAGRTDRPVGDRHAVRGAQSAEVPALHAAGEALTGGDARDVHELTGNEVISGDLCANRDDSILGDAEFRELALRLDLGDGEMAAHCLRDARSTARTDAELERDIAVLFHRAMGDDLAVFEFQHCHGDMFARIGEDAGHSQFLCNHAGAHVTSSFLL